MSRKNRKFPSKPTALVDIVIPVYRSFDLLEHCVASIEHAAKDLPINIILVDNGSPKEEADTFYARLNSSIIVLRNKENLGFPKACNQGARRKTSPLIFFLNSDVILHENAIVELVKGMDDPEVGIAGMKLLFPPGSPSGPEGTIQHVGLATNIRGDFDHLFAGWKPDNPKVQSVRDVIAVTGAALMIRRSLFNLAGGMDEAFGRGTFEDVDLCLRIVAMEKIVRVVQSAVGEHYTNATASRYNLPYPMTQNKLIFMTRWAGKYPWTAWLNL